MGRACSGGGRLSAHGKGNMGYYIEVPDHKGKAQQISDLHGGLVLDHVPEWAEIPEGMAAISVIDNGMFEAAAFCYSEAEYKEFRGDHTGRPQTWVLIDWDKAVELTGYSAGG